VTMVQHSLRSCAAQVAGYAGPVAVMAVAAAAFIVITGVPATPISF